ncbi:ankyrin repeat domain-containing protein [Sinorhizobium fredii]|uniref:ankyrin repeat domain-containing protein n=1 Tax=Rhizobium fredii TaxID=380 RepID=UPI0006860928|nr:ankyrin repeat domain-containing protein [Sinorhizobium fredii]
MMPVSKRELTAASAGGSLYLPLWSHTQQYFELLVQILERNVRDSPCHEIQLCRNPFAKVPLVAFILCLCLGIAGGAVNAGPLHDAARKGDLDEISQLLSQGVDVNTRDESRETALIEAALSGQTRIAAFLIEANADIEARNDRGFTALHAAAYSGSVEIAVLLLDHGAEVDALSKHKITPLHVAAEENQAAVAELLIARGAEVEAIQVYGYTPLSRATFMKSTQVMALLKKHGAQCQPKKTIGASYAACVAVGN